MALLEILEYPDPRLRTKALHIESVDDKIRLLIDNMFETMYAAPGIGLAASQVNAHIRLIVMDISETRDEPLVFINPEISPQGDIVDAEEGCLSVPGYYETVKRPEKAQISALDRNGEPFSLEAEGLLAVCVQHECDHLEGKLFVDYISNMKRQRIRRKLEKQHKLRA
jgi:peptide deformylase